MTYSIHPTHKQTLLFYSTIFRVWKNLDFKAKLFQKISSFIKFHWNRFFYDEFHPFSFHPCPHDKILCHVNLDSIIGGKNIPRISYPCHLERFLKRFYHVHVLTLMLTCSFSHSHIHIVDALLRNKPKGCKYVNRSQQDYFTKGLWVLISPFSFFHMKEFFNEIFCDLLLKIHIVAPTNHMFFVNHCWISMIFSKCANFAKFYVSFWKFIITLNHTKIC
jgi:hypothetical protein